MNQYVVVDLEMCKVPYSNRKKEFHGANETIQIGAVLLNEKYEVVDEFNTYVRPEFGSLDWFITNLTGITSKDLKSAPTMREAMKAFIAWIPEDAFVVNVGRGSAIDEKALTDALNEGKLAGSALDVMQTEPVPGDSPLRTTKNLLLTPHCAGQMTLDYTREKSVEMFCEDLENYLNGRPLIHLVNKDRGY